jgi:hypothetical protein
MANVHYKQLAVSSAHIQQFFFLTSMTHVRDLYKAVVQDPPSWAVSLRPYVLSLASIASRSHTHGTLAPPPRYGRAYTLFSRLLKEPHMSYFHPYWSHSCYCLRWKRVKISSILVNFRGQHVVPFPASPVLVPDVVGIVFVLVPKVMMLVHHAIVFFRPS